MPEVVAERGQAHGGAEAQARRGVVELPVPVGAVEGLAGHVHHAEDVGVAAVVRPWKRQKGEADLADHAQALDEGLVDQRGLGAIELDGAVDRVADFHAASRDAAASSTADT